MTATEINVLSIDELVIAVRELTGNARHGADCWIDPDETHCSCPIGRIRDALPRCAYSITLAGQPTTYRCVSIAHPDQPSKHWLETVS